MEIKQHTLNQWVKEEITKIKVRKYFETNENKTYQNLWLVEAVLRGRYAPVNVYIKKEKSFQNNNLNYTLRK